MRMSEKKGLFRPKEYVRPSNIAEAVKFLAQYGEKARVIAGGTDLLMNKDPEIEVLIDVADLGLNYIESDSRGMKIGAASTFATIAASPALAKGCYHILVEAAHQIGTPQIRNMATIGGNICSAVPSGDSLPSLLALAATISIAGPSGERAMNMSDFFLDVRKNALKRGELLREIHLPTPPARTATAFIKKGRVAAADLALVNGAISLTMGTDGLCQDVSIALGAVAPTPVRVRKAEAMLRGKRPHEELLSEVADCAANEIKPISDVRSSAEYRRELSRVVVERMLKEVVANVSG